jgi:hypothetical protein
MVDYSDSRDSCVGQFDVVYSHPEPLSDESAIYVVDLGTNEALFDEGCSGANTAERLNHSGNLSAAR